MAVLIWHPSRVQNQTARCSGGLRFAATPGYSLSALRAARLATKTKIHCRSAAIGNQFPCCRRRGCSLLKPQFPNFGQSKIENRKSKIETAMSEASSSSPAAAPLPKHLPYEIDPSKNRSAFYENYWKKVALDLLLKHCQPAGQTLLDYGCG